MTLIILKTKCPGWLKLTDRLTISAKKLLPNHPQLCTIFYIFYYCFLILFMNTVTPKSVVKRIQI